MKNLFLSGGKHRGWNAYLFWFLLAVFYSLLHPLTIAAGGSWNLGKYNFVQGQSSGPLLQTLKSGSSLNSYSFVSGVGGVAFAAVAMPDARIGLKKITLRYDPTQPDGRRLGLNIEGKLYRFPIYDWQLIPIARYANSNHNACVSLFGPKTTKTMYDIVYHPAFGDTLLGMRLLQADILLFDLGETWRLPKFNGKTVLGAGESEPSGLNQTSAIEVQSVLRTCSFQSWVMTDEETKVRIILDGDRIRLSGEPHYYFWISNFRAFQQRRAALIANLKSLRSAGKVQEHNQLVKKINSMEPEVMAVKTLTEGLKQKPDALRRLNQAVYDAAKNTMRFAALFRFVKKRYPEKWNIFQAQLQRIEDSPSVKTPTQWQKKR